MHRQTTAVLVQAEAVLESARRQGRSGSTSNAASLARTARMRQVRARQVARTDGASRLRATRRAQASATLVRALKLAAVPPPGRDAELLELGFRATAATPGGPLLSQADRVVAARSRPLRLIVDFGKVTAAATAARHLSAATGRTVRVGGAAPSIEPLLRRPRRHQLYVLELPVAWGDAGSRRFGIAAAIKRAAQLPSVQPSEPLTSGAATVDLTAEPPPPDTEWPISTLRVREAWDNAPPRGGRTLGEGEVIGHLDSGWFDHPEYDQAQLDLARAYNAVTDTVSQTAARHGTPPDGGFNESHGLATGSMMVSAPAAAGTTSVSAIPPGVGEPARGALEVTGVAPRAQVLPVRCLDFVAVFPDSISLVRGAEYLIEPDDPASPAKCGVVSMSLGGAPHYSLEEVLRVGVRQKGVIAVAAAGQTYVVPAPVAAPAAWPDVIGVAASTVDDEPAWWSFQGPEICVSAPGENVWFADVRAEEEDDGSALVRRFVGYGHGTSFCCALLAGAAALWRAFHAPTLRGAGYASIPWARVFEEHVRRTARRPSGWPTGQFGAGVLDVEQLLATPLPAPDEVPLEPSIEPFNPFVAISDLVRAGSEQFEAALQSAAELGERFEQAGEDALNEGRVLVGELLRGAETAAVVAAALAATAARMAAEAAARLEQVWNDLAALAEATGDALGQAAARLAEQAADAWEEAAEAAAAAAEEAARAAEEAAEDVTEFVEEVAESGGEAAEAVVDWVTGWLP